MVVIITTMNHWYKAMKITRLQKEKVHERIKLELGVKNSGNYLRKQHVSVQKQPVSRPFGLDCQQTATTT